MVVDIGEVKRYIKPKADSTLRNMRKEDLIEYIRCLENNYNVAVSFNNQQAKNSEKLLAKAVEVVRCKDCKYAMDMMPIQNSGCLMGECTLRKEDDIVFMAFGDDFCSYGERKEK